MPNTNIARREPGNLAKIVGQNIGRPVLMERNALEEWAQRIRNVDARAFHRPGRLDALIRKLSIRTARAMEDEDDPVPSVPLDQALAYSPRYIGEPDDTGFCWSLKDGVALMSVDTPLLDEGEQFCGMNFHGYDTLLYGMQEAFADARVNAIFLRANSPGGVGTGGIIPLAKWMRENRAAAGGKPIWVYAKMACSAMQWIAAQGDRTDSPDFAYVGSIGAYMVHEDWSEAYAKAGLRITEYAMWENKTDGVDWKPMPASGAADLMAEIEQLVMTFAADITAGRPQVTLDKMKAMRSRAFYSRHDDPERSGLALGLVDGIASEPDTFAALLAKIGASKTARANVPRRAASAEAPQTETGDEAPKMPSLATVEAAPADLSDPVDVLQPSEPTIAATEAAEPAVETVEEPAIMKPGEPVIDLTAEREKVRGELVAEHSEIIELCKLAGRPEMAAEFVRGGKSLADVRAALQDQRAEVSDAQRTQGHIMPDADTVHPQANAAGWDTALAKARGQRSKQ